MKRTRPLTRRTPLKADPAKARAWQDASRAELPAVNKERRKRRADAGLVYGEHHRHVATLPCVLQGLPGHHCWGDVCGHHLKTVATGGEDRRNQVPVCTSAHAEFHARPLSEMCERYRRDFRSLACEITEDYDHTHTGGATP